MHQNPYTPTTAQQPFASRPEPRWQIPVHWAISLIQIAQCALQRIEIAVYDSRISDSMPDMVDPEKSNWIQWQFEMFVMLVPFVSQFALLPGLVILSLNRSYSTFAKTLLVTAAISLAVFTWYNSFVAVTYAIGTFD